MKRFKSKRLINNDGNNNNIVKAQNSGGNQINMTEKDQ